MKKGSPESRTHPLLPNNDIICPNNNNACRRAVYFYNPVFTSPIRSKMSVSALPSGLSISTLKDAENVELKKSVNALPIGLVISTMTMVNLLHRNKSCVNALPIGLLISTHRG